jgi:hypothetical protein
MERIAMSQAERDWLDWLKRARDGKMSQGAAAEKMGVSDRWVIPRDKVEFTFDQHKETQYNAGLLYEWITAHKPDNTGKVSFASRAEPGVQAADLWARELMKRCDTHCSMTRRAPGRSGILSWAPRLNVRTIGTGD